MPQVQIGSRLPASCRPSTVRAKEVHHDSMESPPILKVSAPRCARMCHNTWRENEQEAIMWSMVSSSWLHRKQCSAASNPCLRFLSAVQCLRRTASQRKIFTRRGAHLPQICLQSGTRWEAEWSAM
jgi:hypothetical protein